MSSSGRSSGGGSGAGAAFYDVVGHSIPAGGGVMNGDWNGYVDKLMFMLGTPRRKRSAAVGGAVSCHRNHSLNGDGGFGHVLTYLTTAPAMSGGGPFLPQSDLAVCHLALNDLAILGVANPAPMQEAHRTILARLAAAGVAQSTDASLVFAGTWAAASVGGLNSPAGYKATSTVNDTVTINVPQISRDAGQRTVGFTALLNPAHDLTLGVTVDGVAQPDVRLQGSALCDQAGYSSFGPEFNAITRRYAVDGTATHAIVVTLKTQTVGGSQLIFDTAYIEADSADGPVIVVPNSHRCTSYALWGAAWPHSADMTDVNIATWNTALKAVAAEFPHAVYVDIDAALVKDDGYFNPSAANDGVHPNDVGHGVIAKTIYDTLAARGTLTSRRTSRVSPTLGPWWTLVGANVSGWPAFTNSWVNFGAPYSTCAYRKDALGQVHLKGAVKNGSAANAAIFTLPAGYRPAENRLFGQYAGGAAQVQVSAAGVVSVANGGTTAIQVLDGITFIAEQ